MKISQLFSYVVLVVTLFTLTVGPFATASLDIRMPMTGFDFSLSNSGNVVVGQGSSGSNTITVSLLSGSSQPVTLSVLVSGNPPGVSWGFSGGVGCGGAPTCTVSPPSSPLLTINTMPSTPPGCYPVTVTGTSSGGPTHTTEFGLGVQGSGSVFDFCLLNSGDITEQQGGSGSNTITVTLVSGTAQPVTLSVTGLPAGASPGFSGGVGCGGAPTCTVTPASSPLLTISTAASTPCGTYPVTVTGTSNGGLTHTTQFNLIISQCFDFSLSNSGDLTIQQGSSGSNTITVTLVTPPAQPVTLSVGGLPVGASPGFSGGVGCGGAPTCTVTPTSSPLLTITISISTACGTYPITVTGTSSGGPTHTTQFNLIVPCFDFSVSNSGDLTVPQGSSGSNTITVTLVSGATQPVTLSVTGLPAGASPGFSGGVGCGGAPTCTVSPPSSSLLKINTIASTPSGSYTVTVTGNTPGGPTHTTLFVLTIPGDFALSITPVYGGAVPSANLTDNGTVQYYQLTYQITLNPQNGFTGVVTLSLTESIIIRDRACDQTFLSTHGTCLTCSLSSSTLQVGGGSSILTCGGSGAIDVQGAYVASIVGSNGNGSLVHKAYETARIDGGSGSGGLVHQQ